MFIDRIKCDKIIFTKGRPTIKSLVFEPSSQLHVFKAKYMFEIAKTGKNNGILKIMNFVGNLEILTQKEMQVGKRETRN